jgi:hypothetical protein
MNRTIIHLATLLLVPMTLVLNAPEGAASSDDARETLLDLHKASLQAHFDGNWQWFAAHQADDFVMAYDGLLMRPSREESDAMFRHYFSTTTFKTYDDVTEPLIHVSEDGTLGTVLVQVRVVGVSNEGEENEQRLDATWAWINTWGKTKEGWRLLSNVSNMHDGGPGESGE